ncbi:dehydrogenase [Sphingobacterium humi]|uniref:Dehydrogenase n=2 Tax=Sphingobacterium humi TaxID=1796905 RepID=A0A6N8KUM5_9SPHI|nr:dehydrogenase [Sphingobacterium humi]
MNIMTSKYQVVGYRAFMVTSLLFGFWSCKQPKYPGPKTAEESIAAMTVHPDFEVQIYATEPFVKDPVAMTFDEKGNAYVVEMADYPFSDMEPNPPGKGNGRIVYLKDNDKDGVVDESVVFIEGISEMTSVMAWKKGVLVTAAPDIFYLEDTNGDGTADHKEVLYTGFFTNNSEAQITNLTFAIDNWIYASNHGQAGEITSTRQSDAPALSVGGADFRFRLDKELYEKETAPAQFGQTLNDWGHRFMTQNTVHIQQAVIPGRYMYRHAFLPSTRGVENISDHDLRMYQVTPAPYWRAERSRRRQETYDQQGKGQIEHPDGHFTGASGGTVYGGDAFPDGFYGNIFTGEVAGNLVHRDVLTAHKTSPKYVASRANEDKESEFITSTDSWFRPTSFAVSPDGNLYMVDMYRQHIETPMSIPEDLVAEMDYKQGMDMGRIYRIVPKNKKNLDRTLTDKENKTTADYVKLLAHESQWWRLQAQRKLVEAQDKSVIPSVTELFNNSADARFRLHALYTLEGLGALTSDIVKKALADKHEGVREHAAILAERFPENKQLLVSLLDDQAPRVAFQATLSLGQFNDLFVTDQLAKVAEKNVNDPWFRMAVLSANNGASYELLKSLNKTSFFASYADEKGQLINDLAFILTRKDQGADKLLNDIAGLAKSKGESKWLLGAIEGVQKASGDKGVQNQAVKSSLKTIMDTSTDESVKSKLSELLKI